MYKYLLFFTLFFSRDVPALSDSYVRIKLPSLANEYELWTLNNKNEGLGAIRTYDSEGISHECPIVFKTQTQSVIHLCDFGMTQANDINNNTVVAGACEYGQDRTQACIWSEAGSIRLMGVLNSDDTASEAIAINDKGEVVGNSYRELDDAYSDRRYVAFVYRNGLMQKAFPISGRATIAFDINNKGHIVGGKTALQDKDIEDYDPLWSSKFYPIFFLGRGQPRSLTNVIGSLDDYFGRAPLAINNRDDVTDGLTLYNIQHKRTADLTIHSQKILGSHPCARRDVAINNRGEVVGVYGESGSDGYRIGYVYNAKRQGRELRCYASVRTSLEPVGINDHGVILAEGSYRYSRRYYLLRHSSKNKASSCVDLSITVSGNCNGAFQNLPTGPEQVQSLPKGTECLLTSVATDRITHLPIQVHQALSAQWVSYPDDSSEKLMTSVEGTSDAEGRLQFTFPIDDFQNHSLITTANRKYGEVSVTIRNYTEHQDEENYN